MADNAVRQEHVLQTMDSVSLSSQLSMPNLHPPGGRGQDARVFLDFAVIPDYLNHSKDLDAGSRPFYK